MTHCPHCGIRIDTSSPAQAVIRRAANEYGVTVRDVMSRQRTASASMARALAAYAMRTGLLMTYPRIAATLGRDHTSVIAMVRKVGAKSALSEPFWRRVRRVVGSTAKMERAA